jgi:5-methylcytosine-specific restriction endonuclease McrA
MTISKTLETEVLKRDGWSCRYCGDTATDVDPIVPLLLGGSLTDPANLVSICRPCARDYRRLFVDAVWLVAASHTDEVAARYASSIEERGLPQRLVLVAPEIPGQSTIDEILE